MKVWISKYALTDGIKEFGNLELYISPDNLRYARSDMHFFRLGKDAHETHEAAIAAAESMRKRKIASVRKQLQRLEALSF